MLDNMRTLLSFVAVIAILSGGFTNLCNIDNCYNVTNMDLADQSQYFDPIRDLNQTYTRLVGFRGLTTNCSVTFAAKTSNGATNLKIRWLISQTSINIVSILTGIVDGIDYPVNITDHFIIDGQFNETKGFETQLIPEMNETFLRILIQDDDNEGIIRYESLNYANKFNAAKRNLAQKMVRGLPVNNNTMIRFLKTEHCEGDLTIRLCPCVEPVVTLKQQGTNLTCQGGSIDEIAELLWLKDNDVISLNDTGEQTGDKETLKLHESSTLTNITQTNKSIIYTCKVTTGRNKTTKRSIAIPAIDLPDGNSAGEGGSKEHNKNDSQEHIAYIIFFVVCAILVTLVISTCVVLYLTNERKSREDITLESATNPAFQEERVIPTQTETHDPLLYQSLDNLLQLLDSVAYNRPDEVPADSRVIVGTSIEPENIYDRLDPRLMTVNRGGRIEGSYRLGYV